MRDCILVLLWPRQDIYSFFKNHGCERSDLKVIENYKERELTRVSMVDLMFDRLSTRADGGLGPFRAMLQSLVNWSHFDPYYFDRLGKLKRADAERQLNHLRQLQELRDAKIRREREARERVAAQVQQSQFSLEQLRSDFLDLHSGKLPSQKRGYALEKILVELAKGVGLEVTDPFRVVGEQIDGAIKYEGEHYIMEAKWQDTAASNEPVYQFVAKVEGKMYGRGLFISVNGFSPNVVQSIVIGKAIRTVFVDGGDLIMVLEGYLSFDSMLDRKVKAAQTKGLIYVNPLTGQSKV
jgi:hypothetical protein